MQARLFLHRAVSGFAAATCCAAIFAVSPAIAQKHESNTAKKLGHKIARGTHRAAKATEYGVRKGGENVNVTTHRALGKNSVVRDRGKKKNYIIKPNGDHIPQHKSHK